MYTQYVNPVGTKQKRETPKSKYLDRLRERTKDIHASIEQKRTERNWTLANADYVERLISH